MSYTGAMKNLFGLMIGLEKAQSHYRFSDKNDFASFLTDICVTAKPQYAIMDAIVGMEGPGGPGSGDPIELGFLAASDNILALDWKCASLVGYNPHNIANLEDALKRGIWLKNEAEIKCVGAPEEDCRCSTFKIVKEPSETLQKMVPGWVNFLANKVFIKTPSFNVKKCRKCRRCEQICPCKKMPQMPPLRTNLPGSHHHNDRPKRHCPAYRPLKMPALLLLPRNLPS